MAILYHNPRCSKSRQALALLEEKGVEVTVREYLKEPLSMDELHALQAKLGTHPSEWIRFGDQSAKDLGITKDDSDAQLLHEIHEHPEIMQRPILELGDKAAVGRPDASAILVILGS